MVENSGLIPVDFDDLEDWLVSQGSDFPASELHGALVGALSGAMRLSDGEWSSFALAVMGADERLQYDKDCRNTLALFVKEQLEQLSSDDLSFAVFLPDDEEELPDRVESLSMWCKGFLGGFAEAQLHQSRSGEAEEGSASDKLPDNVAEVLRDMSAIAQVALAGDDFADEDDEYAEGDADLDDMELGLSDYDERDYTELVEYLKLGALTIFTEYGWVEVLKDEASFGAQQRPNSLEAAIQIESNKNRTLH